MKNEIHQTEKALITNIITTIRVIRSNHFENNELTN